MALYICYLIWSSAAALTRCIKVGTEAGVRCQDHTGTKTLALNHCNVVLSVLSLLVPLSEPLVPPLPSSFLLFLLPFLLCILWPNKYL